MTAIRIDDLPVDADTHNDVDLERAGQHRRRALREPQLGQVSGGAISAISASAPMRQVRVARAGRVRAGWGVLGPDRSMIEL